MNRPIACCLTAACLIVTIPATGLATPPVGEHDNGFSKTDERYLLTYERCWKAFDSQCGRNLVDDGLSSGVPPSDERVKESTATMQRWLNPPEPPAVDSPAIVATAPAPPTVAGGSGCVGMEAESGSAGYGAYNSSSGATGCYQIIPSTAAAHGCDLSTPDGQDSCAQSICATQGPSAWSASGANPC